MEAKKLLSLFFFLFYIFDNLIVTMRLEDLNIERLLKALEEPMN